MSGPRYSTEFKDEAVKQIVDRGYSVAEVEKANAHILEAGSYSIFLDEFADALEKTGNASCN